MVSDLVTDFAIALGLLSLVHAGIPRKHAKKIQMIVGVSLMIDLIKCSYMFHSSGEAPSPIEIPFGIIVVAAGGLMISASVRAYLAVKRGKSVWDIFV